VTLARRSGSMQRQGTAVSNHNMFLCIYLLDTILRLYMKLASRRAKRHGRLDMYFKAAAGKGTRRSYARMHCRSALLHPINTKKNHSIALPYLLYLLELHQFAPASKSPSARYEKSGAVIQRYTP
jgi:hypothetical protein